VNERTIIVKGVTDRQNESTISILNVENSTPKSLKIRILSHKAVGTLNMAKFVVILCGVLQEVLIGSNYI
jgi:hypothetical protein